MTAAPPIDRVTRRRLRIAGTILGLLLVVAAIVVVAAHGADLATALAALRSPSPGMLVLLFASIGASILLTAIVLGVLIRRWGRVVWMEMIELVCASTLGNFIPLQPGLVGRVAYHHMVNRIAVKHTVISIAEASIASAASVAILIGSLSGLRFLPASMTGSPWSWLLIAGAGVILLPCAAFARARPFVAAFAARWIEVLAWAARSYACFALIGSPITPLASMAFAAAATAANLVPFIGNGFGVREWTVGLLAMQLPVSMQHQGQLLTLESGLAAELLGRAAEMIVYVPLGLLSGRPLLRRLRQAVQARVSDPQ